VSTLHRSRRIVRLDTPVAYTPNPLRTIEWIGGVNYDNYEHVLGQIKDLMREDRTAAIDLLVTSHGGPSGVGMSFYDTVRHVLRPNLVTIGAGDVDSSGLILFLTGTTRYLTPHTTLMLHMAGRTFGNEQRFCAADVKGMLQEDSIKDRYYAEIVAGASGGRLAPDDVLALMAKTTILTPSEMLELGLAHGIV
jgi:ATP-dependent Clp protease, protease subunit